MAYDFHDDKKTYFAHQQQNAQKYVIPFIEEQMPVRAGMRVLEVGCGEGGVLRAFIERGCIGVGVELDTARQALFQEFLSPEIAAGKAKIVGKNIYDVDIETDLGGKFELIVLKDVIEHIHDQAKIIAWFKQFLTVNGQIYFGFPPWYMPFGGHQQVCRNKWLSKLPYYHLLPTFLYKALLKIGGETDAMIAELLEVKETGISIERFERICRQTGYRFTNKRFYLFNPIYEYKFGLKPKLQYGFISSIWHIRNYLTTCVYYLVKPE